MQVQQVGEEEIVVEAHEGAGVHQEAQDPGGGRQVEEDLAGVLVAGQVPGECGQAGNGQFTEQTNGDNGQSLAPVVQAPGLTGVGVEKGPEHEKGDTHGPARMP